MIFGIFAILFSAVFFVFGNAISCRNGFLPYLNNFTFNRFEHCNIQTVLDDFHFLTNSSHVRQELGEPSAKTEIGLGSDEFKDIISFRPDYSAFSHEFYWQEIEADQVFFAEIYKVGDAYFVLYLSDDEVIGYTLNSINLRSRFHFSFLKWSWFIRRKSDIYEVTSDDANDYFSTLSENTAIEELCGDLEGLYYPEYYNFPFDEVSQPCQSGASDEGDDPLFTSFFLYGSSNMEFITAFKDHDAEKLNPNIAWNLPFVLNQVKLSH